MIGLDGYEPTLADDLIAQGELPALAGLRARSANFALEHGPARKAGLAWEQVASGLAPGEGGRDSAVAFDSQSYTVRQMPTTLCPFVADLPLRTLVFDTPYFDLRRAPKVQGVVNWGAHDPGVGPFTRPESLRAEVEERFGAYPAERWIYGLVWPSVDDTRRMGDALVRAVELRASAARWLLSERLSEWDLGMVVVSECHSAIEALWHGIDPDHPLHDLPSAGPAGEAIREVYRSIDNLIAELVAAAPDAAIVMMSMHGMGPNEADLPGMVLLPELLYRHAFKRPYLLEGEWHTAANAIPLLQDGDQWEVVMRSVVPDIPAISDENVTLNESRTEMGMSLDWMPAARYRPYWPDMPAFALPAFYDGRIRVNLAGREARGIIAADRYHDVCGEIEALLHECRDPATDAEVVKAVERRGGAQPERLGPYSSDLLIDWRGSPVALEHPRLGRIGPLPYRRTGGHTGDHGMALIAGEGIERGQFGTRSSFDVVPTVLGLLGMQQRVVVSGKSLFAEAPAAAH